MADSAIDMVYKKITDVIGGNNPNQVFCMLMPGTVLDKTTYEYDLKKPKTSLVLDAESELVDQLFDICQITSGNNGKLLSEQYLMALSNFIPPIDIKLEEGRKELRKILNKRRKHTLANGSTYEDTLQGIYETLVEKWVTAKREWFEDQLKHHDDFFTKYSNEEARERYNQWYEAVAESRIKEIESRYHALVSIFSPDEFGEIMTVLSCGNKGRFEQMKELTETIRKQNESGGYTYPVDLQPRDWFRTLESNLNYLDLLESPDHISMQIDQKQDLVNKQLLQLDALQAKMPTEGEIKASYLKLKDANKNYNDAQEKMSQVYTQNTITAAKIVIEKYAAVVTGGATLAAAEFTKDFQGVVKSINEGRIDEEIPEGSNKIPLSKIVTPEDFDTLANMQKDIAKSQQSLLDAASSTTDAALEYITKNTMYTDLKPYYQRLKILTEDIKNLKTRLQVASSINPELYKNRFNNEISSRFMQVDTSFTSSAMNSTSKLASSASQTNWSMSFFIGGASGSSSQYSSDFTNNIMNSDTNIQVSFLVTKVNIIRKWFNPGVFVLSKDMKRISTLQVSKGYVDVGKLHENDSLESYNEAILPAYPVAFVIAKDVTIKLEISNSKVDEANHALQSHSASGGGFLCFSVSHSNSFNTESKSFSSCVEGNSVTIRIPGPQIIGWYMEFTPKDDSDIYNPEFLTKQYADAFKDSEVKEEKLETPK